MPFGISGCNAILSKERILGYLKGDDLMDEARAVINLKEGIIELQGPVEFVRHYLNTYQSAIAQLQGLDIAAGPKNERPLSRKGKEAPATKVGKGKRGSSAVAIRRFRRYMKAGFFDEPRAIGDIRGRLNEEGITFTDNVIRAGLRNLSDGGALERVGRAKATHYHRPTQL